ncbi:DEAD/DEAH box helicase, partial [Thauera aminoaromatica S2]
ERGVERSAEARREPAREREGLRAGPRRGRSSVAADGFDFSKPYEPLNPPVAVAEQTQPTVAAAGKPDPLRRHQRPIAVLLGGLGRK